MPLDSPIVLSTVLATRGWVAEVGATWRLAATGGPSELAGLPALTLRADGSCELHAGMEAYLS